MKKDEQEAAAAGLLSKPLTAPGVTKALKDFGVDGEAAGHSPIGSLSHGQRVKIVICASCWQNQRKSSPMGPNKTVYECLYACHPVVICILFISGRNV